MVSRYNLSTTAQSLSFSPLFHFLFWSSLFIAGIQDLLAPHNALGHSHSTPVSRHHSPLSLVTWKMPCGPSLEKEVPSHVKGLPTRYSGKESTWQCRRCKRHGFDPWVQKIPWRRKWKPTPVFLPGRFYLQWSLVGYSPWGRKESDTTEHTHIIILKTTLFTHVLDFIPEDLKWTTGKQNQGVFLLLVHI